MSTHPTFALDNLLAPEVIADPHPLYAELRERHPAHWNAQLQLWVITRYEDVGALLQDPRVVGGWSEERADMQRGEPDDLAGLRSLNAFRKTTVIAQEGAEHARMRRLLQLAFTPRLVELMRATIQHETDRLLDQVLARGSFEAVADLAAPLPRRIIFALCGVPEPMHEPILGGVNALTTSLGIHNPPPGFMARLAADLRAGQEQIRALIAQRRAGPRDDLLGALLLAEEHGDVLSEQELVALVYGLLIGGIETTIRMIGNSLLTLLQHPAGLAQLRANPGLIGTAVEELLRFEPPVRQVMRLAAADLELHGQRIPRGQILLLSLAAANRDPRRFADPNRLDLARQPNRHLSFGYGPHFCVGAALARLEIQIAISTVLRRLPQLRLTGEPPRWEHDFIVRGLQALPLLFD